MLSIQRGIRNGFLFSCLAQRSLLDQSAYSGAMQDSA